MTTLRRVALMALLGVSVSSANAQTPAATPQTADPIQLASQARRLTTEGKHAAAVELFQRALTIDPKLYEAHLGLGIVLDLEGKYAEAREHLARAVELASPEARAQALGAMAVSFVFEGRADEAAKWYQKQFDLQMSAGSPANAASTANALGRVYLEAGDAAKAEQWYRTGYETAKKLGGLPASEVDLWDMRWHHAQSRIAARRGDHAEADNHAGALKALIDKGGPNAEQMPIYRYLVGYNAFYAAKYDDAISALKQADQEDPFILGLMAQAHEKKGDAAAARELWKKVLASSGHAIQNAVMRDRARTAFREAQPPPPR